MKPDRAIAAKMSRDFWIIRKSQNYHQLKVAKNTTIPDNGFELNVNALEWWMRRLFFVLFELLLALVGAKALPYCNLGLVRTEYYKEKLGFQLKSWEIRMNTHNSIGLQILTGWISCAKFSSASTSHTVPTPPLTLYSCPLLPLLIYLPHFLATISIALIVRFPSQASFSGFS